MESRDCLLVCSGWAACPEPPVQEAQARRERVPLGPQPAQDKQREARALVQVPPAPELELLSPTRSQAAASVDSVAWTQRCCKP